MSTTAIAAVVPRRRTTVRGEIVSVVSYERPWVRTDAEVTDGTGTSSCASWVAPASRDWSPVVRSWRRARPGSCAASS